MNALNRFDGKTTTELKEALPLAAEPDQAGTLMHACWSEEPRLAVAATWVVKALVESGQGGHLDMPEMFTVLETADHWEVQLHLLQIVQYAPEAAVDQVAAVRRLLGAKKTLIRVWALDAFVRVAGVRGELRDEARAMIAAGLNDKAASMRARCRNLESLHHGDG
ncbi:MAG: hypothetical protein GY947_06810 [Rhodobacteraceae bacterium]|nr:hypothetical protein [Paracoccaceae bacterium]